MNVSVRHEQIYGIKVDPNKAETNQHHVQRECADIPQIIYQSFSSKWILNFMFEAFLFKHRSECDY